jgi:hypothetical protein
MGLSALEVIQARAPQFSADSRLSTFIALATQRTSSTKFGENYGLAVGLRVLHMLDLEAQRGGGSTNSGTSNPGAVSSRGEGELSEAYFGAMQKRYGDKFPDLCQTAYGVELIELIEGTIVPFMTQIEE